jgi:hypothetical protein
MQKMIVSLLMLTIGFIVIFPVQGQEIFYYRGVSYGTGSGDDSTTWGLTYLEGMGEHAAYSFSYLNEGKIGNHKRDGLGILLWGRQPVWNRRFVLAAGAGPYFYYDTIVHPSGNEYTNKHGAGGMFSIASTLYTEGRFLFQAQADLILTHDDFDSYVFALGAGYQLEKTIVPYGPLTGPAYHDYRTTGREVTLSAGITNLTEISDKRGATQYIEFRCGLARHIDWSVGWMYEADPVSRTGPLTQIWAVQSLFHDRFAIGIGTGPYLGIDRHDDRSFRKVNLLVSGTLSYRFHPNWAIRLSWNRIATDHHRDTDVVLSGLAYRF